MRAGPLGLRAGPLGLRGGPFGLRGRPFGFIVMFRMLGMSGLARCWLPACVGSMTPTVFAALLPVATVFSGFWVFVFIVVRSVGVSVRVEVHVAINVE